MTTKTLPGQRGDDTQGVNPRLQGGLRQLVGDLDEDNLPWEEEAPAPCESCTEPACSGIDPDDGQRWVCPGVE